MLNRGNEVVYSYHMNCINDYVCYFLPFSSPRHCTNLPTLVLTFICERHKDNIISANYAYDLSLVKIKIFLKINNCEIFVSEAHKRRKCQRLDILSPYTQRNKMTFERNLVSKVQLRSSRWYLDDTPDKFAI